MVKELSAGNPEIAKCVEEMISAETLAMLILLGLQLGRLIGVKVIEEVLRNRASEKSEVYNCKECGDKLESKGRQSRKLLTIIGEICWSRQVRRCPKGCKGSHRVPLDEALGVEPNQRIGPHLVRMGCTLAIFVPYETASTLLLLLAGVSVSPMTIWNWVQEAGRRAIERLEDELKAVEEGKIPALEKMSDVCKQMAMLIGADGVMVPFRPTEKTPKGKTAWREVKVGIVARLEKYMSNGKEATRLVQRRVTACLGTADEFQPRLWLLACQQGLHQAPMVIWISDGGQWLWRIFSQIFPDHAIGILDFYHAAQNLWKGIKPWLDGRSNEAKTWFQKARTLLKQGHNSIILCQIQQALLQDDLPQPARQSLQTLYNYLHKHLEHTHFAHYHSLHIPLGSGFVESTCKWLIQQRFKGVGMRWSQNGFNNLLHLRLAWVNGSFDDLFLLPPI